MSKAVTVQVEGVEKLMAKLGDIENVIYFKLGNSIEDSAIQIHSSAVKSLQAHESSGPPETRYNPRRTVTPSVPGSPPNTDRGTLVQSVRFEIDKAKFTAVIGTHLQYGKHLEYGTTKMGARPWLYPAFEKNKLRITDNIALLIKEAIEGKAG